MVHRSKIAMLAAEVMGAKAAHIWLNSPQEELEGRTPIEIWDNPADATKIERLLFKMKDKQHRW